MYLSYYGLSKEPFHITPDPEFLFLTESHRQALGSLIYGIEKRKGFIVITGSIGVGKTTIVRFYLERWRNPRLKVIYIFNPNVTFGQLVKTLCHELELSPVTQDVHEMVNALHAGLVVQYESGNNIALIVDEAQNLPMETLENLRLISNLETAKDKLLQIVFVGQSEFDERLDRDEMRPLRQRVAIRTSIDTMTREESLSYIEHRLAKAGVDAGSIFTSGALKAISAKAKGIPRTINILCDNALITGFGSQVKPVTAAVAREVISDFRGTRRRFFSVRLRPVTAWAVAVILLLAAGGSLLYHLGYADFLPFKGQASRGQVTARAAPAPVPSQPPAVQQETPPQKQTTGLENGESLKRIIQKGDNITRLVKEVYGLTDGQVREGGWMEAIKRGNPTIKDLNRIPVGTEIVFPPLPPAHEKAGDLSD